jgi:hypothetical protein
MGLLKTIAKVGLAPAALGASVILKGVSKITGKDYGNTKEILAEAVETKTGKAIGGATAAVGAALVGVAATTTAAGVAVTKAVTKAVSTAAKAVSKAPAPVKTGLSTAATIAVLAPETTKAIIKSPEAIATAAAAIVSPAAGVVVGLEKGTGLLSKAIELQAPKIAEKVKEAAPIVGAGAVLGAATLGATQLLKDKESILDAELPKETAIIPTQPNTAVTSPVLPQTQTITATTGTGTTKRKKKRSKPLQQHFRQSVNIDINNNNSSNRITKKYINAIALRN